VKTYEFTLSFKLPDADADPAQLLDALYETGCGDATAGVGEPGRLALQFSREGASADEALRSAIRDVLKAVPGAQLVGAKPDTANLFADIYR